MSRVYLSHLAGRELCDYLTLLGHELCFIGDDARFGHGVESHADLRVCKLGAEPESPLLFMNGTPAPRYPDNASFCAVILGRYLIHRLDITHADILKYAMERGLEAVNVRQGYTRCSCVILDSRSIITSDRGIYSALLPIRGLDVLCVSEGHVKLTGYERGFIGGASGRVGDEIIFNGDLSAHPDFERICSFAGSRGLRVKYFPEFELEDIGSIIEEDQICQNTATR